MDTRVEIYFQIFFYFCLSNHLSWSDAEQGSTTKPLQSHSGFNLPAVIRNTGRHGEKGELAGAPQAYGVFPNCGVCSLTAASCFMLIQRITEITWMAVLCCIAKLFFPPYCLKFCITGNELLMLSAKDKNAPKWVHYCSFFFFFKESAKWGLQCISPLLMSSAHIVGMLLTEFSIFYMNKVMLFIG